MASFLTREKEELLTCSPCDLPQPAPFILKVPTVPLLPSRLLCLVILRESLISGSYFLILLGPVLIHLSTMFLNSHHEYKETPSLPWVKASVFRGNRGSAALLFWVGLNSLTISSNSILGDLGACAWEAEWNRDDPVKVNSAGCGYPEAELESTNNKLSCT